MSDTLTPQGIRILQTTAEKAAEKAAEKVTYLDNDLILQVIKKKMPSSGANKQITTLDISDGDLYINILGMGSAVDALEERDIISFRQITIIKNDSNKDGKKPIIINKVNLVSKCEHIIGNPQNVNSLKVNDNYQEYSSNKPTYNQHNNGSTNPNNNQQRGTDNKTGINTTTNNYNPPNSDYNRQSNRYVGEGNNYSSHYENHNNNPSGFDENNNGYNQKPKNFIPLSLLTTFTKEIFILVRVTKKYEIKNYVSKHGDSGQILNFNMIDKDGTELPASGFNKACMKHHPNLEEGKVYEIQGGVLKVNEKKFSSVKSDYKLQVEENTIIMERPDCLHYFKEKEPEYVKIVDIRDKPNYSIVDVVAYVLQSGEVTSMKSKKDDSTFNLRKVTLVDDTECRIELTLWRNYSEKPIKDNDMLVLRYIRVGEYQGRSLTSMDTTSIEVNPQNPEVEYVRNKVEELKNKGCQFKPMISIMGFVDYSLTGAKDVSKVKEILNSCDKTLDDKFSTFTVKATVLSFKHEDRNVYIGCDGCKKKLNLDNGVYRCNSQGGCNIENVKATHFYTFSVRVKDCSGEFFLDFYGLVGEKFLDVTADEYKKLFSDKNNQRLQEIADKVEFKTFLFQIKPKRNNFNNISRIKLNCFKTELCDSQSEAHRMAKNLSELFKLKLNL